MPASTYLIWRNWTCTSFPQCVTQGFFFLVNAEHSYAVRWSPFPTRRPSRPIVPMHLHRLCPFGLWLLFISHFPFYVLRRACVSSRLFGSGPFRHAFQTHKNHFNHNYHCDDSLGHVIHCGLLKRCSVHYFFTVVFVCVNEPSYREQC